MLRGGRRNGVLRNDRLRPDPRRLAWQLVLEANAPPDDCRGATGLHADARLRELEDGGVIERRPRADGAGHEYWLTPAGEGFRAVLHALGQ